MEGPVQRVANSGTTLENLRQHELIILRRLLAGPLTEFDLVAQIAEHSGYTPDSAHQLIGGWLDQLREDGLIWSGKLVNNSGQYIFAAILTRRGRELVE
jgi:DNA-binding PadR family transcriptional regulator